METKILLFFKSLASKTNNFFFLTAMDTKTDTRKIAAGYNTLVVQKETTRRNGQEDKVLESNLLVVCILTQPNQSYFSTSPIII